MAGKGTGVGAKDREYYLGYYAKSPVKIVHEFKMNGAVKAVVDTGEDHLVVWKSDLTDWENTALYQQEERARKRLDELNQNYHKLLKKMQNDAVKALTSRIRLNVAFGGVEEGAAGLLIVEELEKLIYKTESEL